MRVFRPRILLTMLIAASIAGCALVGFRLYHDVRNSLTLTKPAATALLEDRYGNFLSESALSVTQDLGYWDVPFPLPERVEAAFLAAEDQRFYKHAGVEARAVARAVWQNLTTSRRQGASTIAMQVARMQRSLSSTSPYRRGYWQKLCESVTALLLIRKFGHSAVLQHYLAIVPQGNRIHGAAYAARRYFRKPLSDLTWAEAALLAALPKAPGQMNLFRPEGQTHAVERAAIILKLLSNSGRIDAAQFQTAIRQLARITIPEREIRPTHSYHAILRLEDILRERGAQHYARPLRTSLDLSIQSRVADLARDVMANARANGAGNIAMMVVEKATGKVVAYVGSEDYVNAQYAGAINYARVPRSSGSTLKPFIYALGLERRVFTPASLLSDRPILVSLPHGYYQIGNYDGQNLGYLLYRKALANSRNVPAVHVLAAVGIDNAYELFRQLGLTEHARTAAYYGVGMAIGTLYVTLEDLVTAYGVLANEGRSFRLQWFEAMSEPSASTRPRPSSERILDQNVARQISLFLSDPLARLPTFARMGALEYPFPVAVKTGTSQGFRDAWAVAYSGKYIVGAWLGHPENTRMRDISGTTAAQAVKQIMLALHPEERRGVAEHPFAPPDNYTLVKLCASTGKTANAQCPDVLAEYFAPGPEPTISAPNAFAMTGIQTNLQPTGTEPTSPGSAILSTTFHALSLARSPFSFEALLNASVTIREPHSGAVFVLDPDTPRGAQTLPLQATASPQVAKLVWYVDGEPVSAAAYPYTIRWPLEPGRHVIQARFANADIVSDPVAITVY